MVFAYRFKVKMKKHKAGLINYSVNVERDFEDSRKNFLAYYAFEFFKVIANKPSVLACNDVEVPLGNYLFSFFILFCSIKSFFIEPFKLVDSPSLRSLFQICSFL